MHNRLTSRLGCKPAYASVPAFSLGTETLAARPHGPANSPVFVTTLSSTTSTGRMSGASDHVRTEGFVGGTNCRRITITRNGSSFTKWLFWDWSVRG